MVTPDGNSPEQTRLNRASVRSTGNSRANLLYEIRLGGGEDSASVILVRMIISQRAGAF